MNRLMPTIFALKSDQHSSLGRNGLIEYSVIDPMWAMTPLLTLLMAPSGG